MTWRIQHVEHQQFTRNPLDSVVGQLSFHPVLKLRDCIPDIQEQIRATFPRFSEGVHRHVIFDTAGNATVQEHPQFVFRDTQNDWRIALRMDSLIVLCNRHESHHKFARVFNLVADSVSASVELIGTRFGLRYINMIDRNQLGDMHDSPIDWKKIVNSRFLPSEFDLDLENAHFLTEIDAQMADGNMVVRHGIVEQNKYRIDLDRYHEFAVSPEETPDVIESFSQDIFSLFYAMAGPKLLEWMQNESP